MNQTIRIIGVPIDLGQHRRGVNMGPDAIRYAGLAEHLARLGYHVEDRGNIHVPVRDTVPEVQTVAEIARTSSACYDQARKAIEDGTIPIFLGGDHTIAVGSVGGVTHDAPCGVVWIDAHADFNTPAISPSGNVHGMSLSILLGNGHDALVCCGRSGAKIRADQVVLVGIRDLDPLEKEVLARSGITTFTMRDIDEMGMSRVARETVSRLSHLGRLHVSLDMDSLEPAGAPGVGTPVPGGLTYREAHLLMEILADSHLLSSMDIVEINPIMDTSNQTATLAVKLAVSLFGKRIL
ncbi:arginase [Desulfoluna butyratoxydans]|uniref:Arginase n=1 Tax=Desulfoluna butyratoxydans TaxID=231438 RepID=A0A4U8YNL1_9BACT|nr:arginase [Desulfoluna butyratoxydans]VFQ43242.1 ureohydrolase [Desulfoluna butyratoxydans]